MPTTLPPTWSWQLLPAAPSMKDIRRTGRGLKRHGPRLGLKAGTSDAEQARIMSARWLHIYTTPHTQRADLSFNDDMGEPFDQDDAIVMVNPTRVFNPYTLANICDLCETAFQLLADTTPEQSYARGEVTAAFTQPARLMGTRSGVWNDTRPFVLAAYRAIVTVREDYTPTQDKVDDYLFAVDMIAGSRDYLAPVKGSAAQVRYQPPATGGDTGAWSALPFADKWLC